MASLRRDPHWRPWRYRRTVEQVAHQLLLVHKQRQMIERSRRTVGAIGIATLSIGLCGCTPGSDSTPIVSATELQEDLTDRLVRQGRAPMSVTCTKDLVGEQGRSARCDVVFSESSSMEVLIETTTVNGEAVQYEVRPKMTKEQTERLVTALTSASSAVCDSGLDSRLATTAHCEVDKNGSVSMRAVVVETVRDLELGITVFPVLLQEQVQDQLRGMLSGSSGERPESVQCARGISGKKDSIVECIATFDDAKKTYVVTVTGVDDENVTLGAEPKYGDGPGAENGVDYCRGCPG